MRKKGMNTKGKNRPRQKTCRNNKGHSCHQNVQFVGLKPETFPLNNPQTVKTNSLPKIVINAELCVACKKCERVCLPRAIIVKETATVDNSLCIRCGKCIRICPNQAISYNRSE